MKVSKAPEKLYVDTTDNFNDVVRYGEKFKVLYPM